MPASATACYRRGTMQFPMLHEERRAAPRPPPPPRRRRLPRGWPAPLRVRLARAPLARRFSDFHFAGGKENFDSSEIAFPDSVHERMVEASILWQAVSCRVGGRAACAPHARLRRTRMQHTCRLTPSCRKACTDTAHVVGTQAAVSVVCVGASVGARMGRHMRMDGWTDGRPQHPSPELPT